MLQWDQPAFIGPSVDKIMQDSGYDLLRMPTLLGSPVNRGRRTHLLIATIVDLLYPPLYL